MKSKSIILICIMLVVPLCWGQIDDSTKLAVPMSKLKQKKECPRCGNPNDLFYKCDDQTICLECSIIEKYRILSHLPTKSGKRIQLAIPFAVDKNYKCRDCQIEIREGYYCRKDKKAYCFFCTAGVLKKFIDAEILQIEAQEEKLEEKHWKQALRVDCVSGYEEYLRRYPDAKNSVTAQTRLKDLTHDYEIDPSKRKIIRRVITSENSTKKNTPRKINKNNEYGYESVLREIQSKLPLYGTLGIVAAALIYWKLSGESENLS